jgi:hypothetical protein
LFFLGRLKDRSTEPNVEDFLFAAPDKDVAGDMYSGTPACMIAVLSVAFTLVGRHKISPVFG